MTDTPPKTGLTPFWKEIAALPPKELTGTIQNLLWEIPPEHAPTDEVALALLKEIERRPDKAELALPVRELKIYCSLLPYTLG